MRPGQVVLITGGSVGIGAACLRQFLKRGLKCAVVALPGDDLDRWAGPNVLTIPGDITREETRCTAVEMTLTRFGKLDILINNACVGLYSLLSILCCDLARRLFEVNFFAPLALTQLVIPIMRGQGSGTIVNIGSVGGYVSLPWAVGYCASKSALRTLNDALRREVKRDSIDVLEVCPGIVDTAFRDHVLAGAAPARVADIRRIVPAEAVADAVIRGINRRKRVVHVPPIARLFTAMDVFAPRLMDWYLRRFLDPVRAAIPLPRIRGAADQC